MASEDGDAMSTLSEVVLETIAFLELSGDDVIDPDAAVTMLESIAADLQRLTSAQRVEFLAVATRLADATQDARRRELFEGVAESLGLA